MTAGRLEGAARKFERAVSLEIRRARERAGAPRSRLARATGMTEKAFAELEAGRRALRLGMLYSAAIAIGVDVEDLLIAARRRMTAEDGSVGKTPHPVGAKRLAED